MQCIHQYHGYCDHEAKLYDFKLACFQKMLVWVIFCMRLTTVFGLIYHYPITCKIFLGDCTMAQALQKMGNRNISTTAPIFSQYDYFRENIWRLSSVHFHFCYIFGDQLNTANCRRRIYNGPSFNSSRLQEGSESNLGTS